MKTSRKLNRRSFLASVAGAVAIGAGAGMATAQNAKRCPLDDNDSGAASDRVGRAATDQDSGANADPACPRARTPRVSERRCSDTDRGRNADPAYAGRRC